MDPVSLLSQCGHHEEGIPIPSSFFSETAPVFHDLDLQPHLPLYLAHGMTLWVPECAESRVDVTVQVCYP